MPTRYHLVCRQAEELAMELLEKSGLTEPGRARLEEQLERLVHRRAVKWDEFTAMVDEGETQSPAADSARQEVALLDERIDALRRALADSSTVAMTVDDGRLAVGGTVCVRWSDGEESRYTIVRPIESAPSAGRLSSASPIGQAILGRRVGDEVTVQTPDGLSELLIVDITR